jgi:hypothetical protein
MTLRQLLESERTRITQLVRNEESSQYKRKAEALKVQLEEQQIYFDGVLAEERETFRKKSDTYEKKITDLGVKLENLGAEHRELKEKYQNATERLRSTVEQVKTYCRWNK